MSDKDNVVQFLPLKNIHEILNEGIERDVA